MKKRATLFRWAVRYTGEENTEFAQFVSMDDAEAFVTLLKLVDGIQHEIIRIPHGEPR